ncbi:MAG TPA: NADAR family protein [Patescibacteria group bacterium]|nr:NADAR family protein [Patescibacteria group bacterium]
MYPSHDQHLSHTTDDTIFFFSHAFDPLNNWSAHQVRLWGSVFSTVEHGFHYRKFADHEPTIATNILKATSPYVALQLARRYTAKRRPDWNKVKVDIMAELVRAKVAQHNDVRSILLETGDKTIVENSPWDNFWGNGPDNVGQNHMGRILMQVRSELQKEKKYETHKI